MEDRRTRKTKEAIIQAYFALVSEKGKDKITVTELSRRANIDRKTFYLHYETPEDILREFGNDKVDQLLKLLGQTDFFEEPYHIDHLFQVLNDLVASDIQLYRQLAWNTDYGFFWDRVKVMMVDAVLTVYSDYVTVSPDELRIYCDFFVAGLISIYQDWLRSDQTLPLEQLGSIVSNLASKGILHLLKKKDL